MTNPHQKQITSFQIKHQIWIAKTFRGKTITESQAIEEILNTLSKQK